ncbi:MAG: transcriptional regulator, LuxR family protein [Oscillospiraceae bacterium]|jgi:DNA-binding CsgD family transcriptional regulator|nr:transcriptional regulator, LuxR family protein [Oscillospiraceae bacterium]
MGQETTEQISAENTVNYNVANFKWLRKKNIPYVLIWILYYTWVIAFATWWTASPLTENVFNTQLRELMHAVTLISSAVFVFAIPFAVLLGIGSTIGMINMYYILGVIGKKYDSMRFVRLYIFFVGIFGGVSGIAVGDLISRIGAFQFSVLASVFSVVVMIAFMFISPVMEREEYVNVWGLDSQFSEIDNEQLNIFLKYKLSRREIEVCKLLLQGYTLRQISGILSIGYSTVNTYCTNIYRKTKINSRTELMQVFKDYRNK